MDFMKIVSALIIGLAVSSFASGAEYFVDGAKGDDKNSGETQSPYKTIGAARKMRNYE